MGCLAQWRGEVNRVTEHPGVREMSVEVEIEMDIESNADALRLLAQLAGLVIDEKGPKVRGTATFELDFCDGRVKAKATFKRAPVELPMK